MASPAARSFPLYHELPNYPDPPRHHAPRAGRRPRRRWLCPRHGQGGRLPGHLRPGATNLVTGIATAQMDSSPIVAITGPGVHRRIWAPTLSGSGHHRHHHADHQAQLSGHRRDRVWRRPMQEAFHIARTGRPGPVLIDITEDAQMAETEFDVSRGGRSARLQAAHGAATPRQITQAAEMINEAERPMIMAGRGVIVANAASRAARAGGKGQHPGGHHAAGQERHRPRPIRCAWAWAACTARPTPTMRCSRPI